MKFTSVFGLIQFLVALTYGQLEIPKGFPAEEMLWAEMTSTGPVGVIEREKLSLVISREFQKLQSRPHVSFIGTTSEVVCDLSEPSVSIAEMLESISTLTGIRFYLEGGGVVFTRQEFNPVVLRFKASVNDRSFWEQFPGSFVKYGPRLQISYSLDRDLIEIRCTGELIQCVEAMSKCLGLEHLAAEDANGL